MHVSELYIPIKRSLDKNLRAEQRNSLEIIFDGIVGIRLREFYVNVRRLQSIKRIFTFPFAIVLT